MSVVSINLQTSVCPVKVQRCRLNENLLARRAVLPWSY